MYKRPSYNIKTSGSYIFKTKDKNYKLESFLFERQNDTEDSLQIQDELRGELGSIIIKNSSWNKLSNGDAVRAKSSKGNVSGALVRVEKMATGGEIKSIKKGDRIKDKYGYEAEVYYADGDKIEAQYKSGATYTYRQKDFDNGYVRFLWSDRKLFATGGGVGDDKMKNETMNKMNKGGSIDAPKIYVADLEAYNNGKLVGEWLDLSDFEDGKDVSKEISKLLKKWGAEEYAIHDVENVPSSMYSEYMGEEDFDKIIKIYKASEESDLPYEVISEIILQYEPEDLEEWISEHYEGHFDNDTDLAYSVVENMGSVSDLGEKTTEMYFDYEKFGRDLAINDEWEGDFDSDEDRGYDYVENMGGVSELGEKTIDMYFDYEKFGRDLAIDDYTEIEDGYYFRTPRYAKGGLTNERRYVNKSEDYEVRYAKNRLKRTGYKNERKFAVGGEVGNQVNFRGDYGKKRSGIVTGKKNNGYIVATDDGNVFVESYEIDSFEEAPVAKKKRFGFFEGGGEIQSKIDKLQSVVNSKMLPESVKDKARKQITELEKELHESKETKAEEKEEHKAGGSEYKSKTEKDLEKELHRLQRDLNSSRLQTYIEGDDSKEAKANKKEREVKLARFNEVLALLNKKEEKPEVKKPEIKKPTTRKAPVKKAVAKKLEVKKDLPKIKVGDTIKVYATNGDLIIDEVFKNDKGEVSYRGKYIANDNLKSYHSSKKVYEYILNEQDVIAKTPSKPKADHKKLLAKIKAKKGDKEYDNKASLNPETGERRKRSESSDKKRDALPLGKRVSASGRTYYENRLNRGDISKEDKFEGGGEIGKENSGWGLKFLKW